LDKRDSTRGAAQTPIGEEGFLTMLDADPAHLTQHGTVTIHSDGSITVAGFNGQGTTCRDVTALAAVWAIEHLTKELRGTLERPGGGRMRID
jgi:hypothetical protein